MPTFISTETQYQSRKKRLEEAREELAEYAGIESKHGQIVNSILKEIKQLEQEIHDWTSNNYRCGNQEDIKLYYSED